MSSNPFTSRILLLVLLLATVLPLAPLTNGPEVTRVPKVISDHIDFGFKQFQSGDVRFGENRRVNSGGTGYPQQVEPTLTILSDGRILAGWKEADTHNGPGLRVGFAYSTDDGQTFSQNILMETVGANEYQSDPWLIKDSADNAYFTFLEYGGPGEGMGVAKTTDGGVTWQSPTQASDTVGYLDDKETVCIDSSDNIYTIWDHFVSDTGPVYLTFTKSTNGGASFQPTSILGTWEERGGIAYITCTPNGTLFVSTILDSDPLGPIDTILFTKSTDYGATWTPSQQVNPPGMGEIAIITVCATDSNHDIYICFAAGSPLNYEVYLTKSTDGGANWSLPLQINDDTTGMQRMVEMYIDPEDNIHIAWLDGSLGEWNIFYSYSTDGGTTFSDDVKITTEGTSFSYTRPGDYFTLRSGPDGRLYIVWTDGRGSDQDIYFAKQDITPPQLTHNPSIAAYQNQPYTVTVDATDDDNVAFVEFHYRIDSEPWVNQLLVNVEGSLYQGIIPANEVIGTTLSYYFTANDTANRQGILPTTGHYTVPIQVFSPTLILIIAVSIAIIVIVIIFAIWYLRRPPK